MTEPPATGSASGAFDLEAAQRALASSSTTVRLAQLRVLDEKLSHNDLDRPATAALLETLFWTHAFYHDRPSRRAAQRCLAAVARTGDPDLLAPLVAALRREAQKSAIAAGSAFVFVEWCALLTEELAARPPLWARFGADLLLATADALERCLRASAAKGGLARSALVSARRGLRKLVSHADTREQAVAGAVQTLTRSGGSSSGGGAARRAVLLGVVAGVCARIPAARPLLEAPDNKGAYLAFYAREMVGSRTPLPPHVAAGLGDFFAAFVTADDLARDVAPALEKGLLRAPEVVLDDLVTPLVRALPAALDLSALLRDRLLKPLRAQVQSSSPAVRHGAVRAFRAVVARCRDAAALEQIADEVAAPLRTGKLAGADQKVLHAEMLEALLASLSSSSSSTAVASKLAAALPAALSKEGNEAALAAESLALNAAALALLSGSGSSSSGSSSSSEELPAALVDAYRKGLADKKPSVRRVWVLRAGDVLAAFASAPSPLPPAAARFAAAVLPPILAAGHEAVANPLAAAQNGLVTSALVACALASYLQRPECAPALAPLAPKEPVQAAALRLAPKPSFLLSPRVYGKLALEDDFRWLCRALTAVWPAVAASSAQEQEQEQEQQQDQEQDQEQAAVASAWAQAFVYLICAAAVPVAVRREAGRALSRLYAASAGRVARVVVRGLWDWLQARETGDKDSAAAVAKAEQGAGGGGSGAPLHLVLRAICPTPEEYAAAAVQTGQTGAGGRPRERLEAQMCSLLVLARPELVGRAGWIELCLRVGVDPGDLARRHGEALMEEILRRTGFEQEPPLKLAAFRAAAELAFVAPDAMTPRVLDLVRRDLAAADVRAIGPLEAAIFRTPDGTAFVDVLAAKPPAAPPKNAKDYDTLRWEEELRAQLAAKKGAAPRKLTADEAAKVRAQLQKEAAVRDHVRRVEARLVRGCGIVTSLATGPPTDAARWMAPVLQALLDVIDAGAARIAGDAAPRAYLACAERVTPRLGAVRPFVGVATLRARDHDASSSSSTSAAPLGLPAPLLEEPFVDLVTRVLYRLRFVAEQRPLDAVSFVYALPLLLLVLRSGGYGPAADERDAQLVLAVEILSFHGDVCAAADGEAGGAVVPRAPILSALLFALQRHRPHYKRLKDAFADLVRCLAPSLRRDELAVLARGAVVPQAAVRAAVLQAVSAEVDMSELGPSSDELWLACHDDRADNAALARDIWAESDFAVSADLPFRMLPYLLGEHDAGEDGAAEDGAAEDGDGGRGDAQLRRAAARALAEATRLHPATRARVLAQLQDAYRERARPRAPPRDEFALPRKTAESADPWEARHGVACALRELAPHLAPDDLAPFFDFLIAGGPLGDAHAAVRRAMLDAALAAVARHGPALLDRLMPTLEATLAAAAPAGGDPHDDADAQTADRVHEAVVLLYGALARHLPPGDAKIPVVLDRLLAALATPSETVQYAIAECLPPLVRAVGREPAARYVDRVLQTLLVAPTYAVRRGAAYGLAGLVAGRGIAALREQRVLAALAAALGDKRDAARREAALLAYELLAARLGRLFEPYVVRLVPQLLAGFGDASPAVRDAALAAARAAFARLSSFGVAQILPPLLAGLDDPQWRSKKAACDLLGAMAYLDPPQLAARLPDLVPPLTAALADSHKEVRAAARASLRRFGEVITNPEVAALVDVLLRALSDPARHTDDALDALLAVRFVHYLDAPSLALVGRVLQRGLADRGSSATRRKAAQVIGSLAHLTDRRDLAPHLPALVAGLRAAAVDPVPATRATAARALGSLVEKLGEDALPDLIPSLLQALQQPDADSAGDRLGSAQALSEVLAGLGTARLEQTLPTILHNAASPRPAVREAFLSLFVFLPVCFGASFAAYLGRVVPPLLAGLADDAEPVRDTALRAGRLLVKNFAARAVDLLLPALERGLADDRWRIRLSSVELVGDLLFTLAGVRAGGAGKGGGGEERGAAADDDDDEGPPREAGAAALREVLGDDQRNRILAALYVCRCDTAAPVRAAAVAVWKALVPSPPRTLRELVPTLTQLLIRRLGGAAFAMEHKVIAGNALGELVRKAGDGVLASLLPTLEAGLQTATDRDAKQGICLALRELVAAASPDALDDHERTLVAVVRAALTDPDPDVRDAAADAFDALQRVLGRRAVDQVLPYLLGLLRAPAAHGDPGTADHALAALLTLLTDPTRSAIILPALLPTLLAPPLSAFDARALASLARVAGPAMNRRLPAILHALMDALVACGPADDDPLRAELDDALDAVLLSVDEHDGLNTAMSVLLQLMKHDDHRRRAATAAHLARFFAAAGSASGSGSAPASGSAAAAAAAHHLDYARYHPDIVRALLVSFDDRDPDVVRAAWAALSEFTKRLRKEEMEALVPSTRQTLLQVGVPGHPLPGFELPRGVGAVLPIFLQGLMNGAPDQRVQAALAISDLVDRASEDALKPFVTQIAGPLIRVVSERSADVKAAVLLTLNNLLAKMPAALRPFLPQLQRTFAKSLADPASDLLRSRAAKALGTLIQFAPRVDPLVAELVAGSRTSDPGVRTAMLKALYEVVAKAGAHMGEASRAAVLGLLDAVDPAAAGERDDKLTVTYAKLFGALVRNVAPDVAAALLRTRVLTRDATPASVLALNAVLVESPAALLETALADDLPELLCHGMTSKTPFIADNFVLAAGKYLLAPAPKPFDATRPVFATLASLLPPGAAPADTRRLALVLVRTVARAHQDLVRPHLGLLAPPVFASVRDVVIPVKLAAEAAFVELFSVADENGRVFDKWIAAADLPAATKRSMQDYFKRVALRLGSQVRERREAEGGAGGLGLANDEVEDEREIWSVGKMEVGADVFDREA